MAALILCAVYGALLLTKAALASWEIRRQTRHSRSGSHEKGVEVTILQPILSGDPYLEAVLEDNVRAHESAQFMWLIDSDDSEAHAVARRLRDRYPLRKIEIQVSPQPPEGVNPKAFKLDLALDNVTSEVVIVLDDDSRLSKSSLAALVTALDGAELCTALPAYRDDRMPAAMLLAQFVNNNAALTFLPLLPLRPPVTINGMCYALRRDYLRSLGGFARILNCLTDDLAMAELVAARGGRIHQSIATVEVQTGLRSLNRYMQQMHRWNLFAILLLRRQTPWLNVVIALLQGVHPLILWGLIAVAAALRSQAAIAALAAALGLRLLVLVTLHWVLTGHPRMRLILSILSELLQPLHYVHALFYRTIRLRTRHYVVFDNDCFRARP
jgi:ceramide glucosyltransferase